MMVRVFFITGVLSFLAGCTVLPNQNPTLSDRDLSAFNSDFDRSRLYMTNATLRTFDAYGEPGNRVLFFAQDGEAHFWNQDGTLAEQRFWALRKDLFVVELCLSNRPIIFDYDEEKGDDTSKKKKKAKPRLPCTDISAVIATHRERGEGDLFNLSSGRTPFDLPDNEEMTFADIQQRIRQGGS